MQPVGLSRARPTPIDRSADRRVALAGITLAITFLAAAIVSLALPPPARHALWLPLHLALAGGASCAIAGVMPFFVAAFAAAQPADARLRVAGLVCIAVGAIGVATGVVAIPGRWLAPVGGVVYIAGIILTGAAAIEPLSGALGPSRGLVTQAYVAALAAVTLGATIATLDLAGWPPIVESWSRLRPAHAWLNLVGFVSLVTATTLLHFFPTVVGGRIRPHPSARLTILGLGVGSFVVAAGYWLALDPIVRLGAAAAVVGSFALVVYAVRTWRARARWTTDQGWHRFAIGGLGSAITWFVVGMVVMGGGAVAFGAAPSGWSIEPVFAPLVAGWIGLAIVAAATHLVPAVGPGDQAAHARQRSMLGRGALTRLVATDCGIAAIALGVALGRSDLAAAGVVLTGLAFAATALLLAVAIAIGLATPARPPAVTSPGAGSRG